MVDNVTDEPVPSADLAPPAVPDDDDGRTVEAVEAEYQARISGKDKAHAAEKRALEARIASLEAETQQKVGTQMTELEQLKADNARLAAEKAAAEGLAQEKVIEARKARFPNAAESLGDDLVGTMDETRLTELETRLAGAATPGTGQMLSNMAHRPAGEPPKDVRDKTVAELEADLRKYAGSSGFDSRE